MAGKIEKRSAHSARSANDKDRCTRCERPVARQHLVGGEISERDAHGFGRVDAVRDRHKKLRRPDRILRVATGHAEIGGHLTFAQACHARAGLVHHTDEVIAGRERQRAFEIGVTAAPDEGVGETRACGQHLDAHLARAGLGKGFLLNEFQNFGAAKAGDADVLPRHHTVISVAG
jgi:hypothetical protein